MYRVNYGNGRVSAAFGSLRAAVAVLVSTPDEPRAFVQTLDRVWHGWLRVDDWAMERALVDHTRSVL